MDQSDDSARDDAPPTMLEMDHVFDALDHPRRRYLLYTLRTDYKQSLWELARRIAAWEGNVPDVALSEDVVGRVYVSLYHNHVPKLATGGVISFSEAEETIASGSNAEEVMAILDEIGGFKDSNQEAHAQDEHGEGYS